MEWNGTGMECYHLHDILITIQDEPYIELWNRTVLEEKIKRVWGTSKKIKM
jgi:hypothetical protein